jgi:extradiol dioxygenase family protein
VRTTSDVFHLAIPTHDLDAAQDFYVTRLGCKLARRYHDRITLDFFGDQVVCHLTPGEPAAPSKSADFDRMHACAVLRKIPFYHEVSLRFEGLVEEHRTFVLADPTGNLLEFKHYNDPRMMY